MENILKHISLPEIYCCTELSKNRVLVTGNKFIKIYSLNTYKELKDIPSEDQNLDSLMTTDERYFFITTSRGIKHYSLLSYNLVKVHEPTSNGFCLTYLKSKWRTVFNDNSRLICLYMNTSIVIDFKNGHSNFIRSIASTSDEEFVFSTGLDKTLKQWSTNSWEPIKSANLKSEGTSLFVKEDLETILVGMTNGSLSEYSLHNLLLVRTIPVHKDLISKIIRLSSGIIMTCSRDGTVCFPFRDNVPIKVSDRPIYSITELSDKRIACCGGDGVRFFSPSIQDLPLVENPGWIAPTLDSISSSLDSIRKSTSCQKSQLISLLQHHLIQLTTSVKPQPVKFTGLIISLLPDLKFIQRSHCYEGLSEGRKKILTQKYILEMISSKSVIPDSEAILTLFDRKIKVQGKITNVCDPSVDFRVRKMLRGNWIFSIDQEFVLDDSLMNRPATAHFSNGHLNFLINEGNPLTRSGFQATLNVDGINKSVSAIGNDGVVVTTDRKVYLLNFKRNKIEHHLRLEQ